MCDVPTNVLHASVGSLQSEVWLHWTHVSLALSPETSHTGVAAVPTQFASDVHATHVFVVVLHAGVDPEHCALVTHATHDTAVPPNPLQTPPVHGVPGPAFPHVPLAQVLHSPEQATLQQTLPTHSLLVHSSFAVQVELFPPFGTQVPLAPGFEQ